MRTGGGKVRELEGARGLAHTHANACTIEARADHPPTHHSLHHIHNQYGMHARTNAQTRTHTHTRRANTNPKGPLLNA